MRSVPLVLVVAAALLLTASPTSATVDVAKADHLVASGEATLAAPGVDVACAAHVAIQGSDAEGHVVRLELLPSPEAPECGVRSVQAYASPGSGSLAEGIHDEQGEACEVRTVDVSPLAVRMRVAIEDTWCDPETGENWTRRVVADVSPRLFAATPGAAVSTAHGAWYGTLAYESRVVAEGRNETTSGCLAAIAIAAAPAGGYALEITPGVAGASACPGVHHLAPFVFPAGSGSPDTGFRHVFGGGCTATEVELGPLGSTFDVRVVDLPCAHRPEQHEAVGRASVGWTRGG